MAKHAIEPRCCSVFGMDAHVRPIAVESIVRSIGATATKRFDDVPAPSEIASWMQSGSRRESWCKRSGSKRL